jgi:hypothetical protein
MTPNARARDVRSLNAIVVRMYTGGINSAVPTPSMIEFPRISTPRPGGNCAQRGTDSVQGQTSDETTLAAPAVRQLAAGDHEDRHDQQEQRDRELDALNRRVEVLADVVDHHVHVRASETADELSES